MSWRGIGAVLALVALLLLGAAWSPRRAAEPGAARLRVALFVNGTLGDKSFFDSAARGLRRAEREFGLQAKIIEGGNNSTRWEAALTDLVDGGDFDVVVAGSFAMVPHVERLAGPYPQTRFIVFDAAVSTQRCACANVHSMLFRQNEGAYLAGFLAADLTDSQQRLGVVGGMQIPVIDDFILGFQAGAEAARPGIRIERQYVNSFTDPATAKEIAKAMYGQGASLVFQAAAGSGQGVIEAAAEAGRLVIGVDSDQYAIVQAANPQRARAIVTSVLKNVDVALFQALARHRDGTLAYGTVESLGLAEGGVSLAEGSPAWRGLSPALRARFEAARERVVGGAVRVPSAFAQGGRP